MIRQCRFLLLLFSLLSFSCESQDKRKNVQQAIITIDPAAVDTATFAGGCFWCVEAVFDRVEGVSEAVSGYSGGDADDANYQDVSYGRTDHAEAVEIYYNSDEVSYEELLEIFFATHDPTQLNRQGPDVGRQYRSAIFYHNNSQRNAAEKYIAQLEKSKAFNSKIVTQLNSYEEFYIAEDYHQDYYNNNPGDSYIQSVTRPKILKFEKQFKDKLKKEYR